MMKDSDTRAKAILTTFMWLSYLGFVLIGLNMLEIWGILLAFVLMIPVVMLGMSIWVPDAFIEDSQKHKTLTATEYEAVEKRKRDRLSQALSQLSDTQLNGLRDGIRDGTIDDERLRYMIDDDELIERYN